MVTWAQLTRGTRAWTVRPDLWPPGVLAWVKNSPYTEYLALWTVTAEPWRLDYTPVPGSCMPGVGEALVLAGRVRVDPCP